MQNSIDLQKTAGDEYKKKTNIYEISYGLLPCLKKKKEKKNTKMYNSRY